jgi:glycolate oxidase FAD binding subunit
LNGVDDGVLTIRLDGATAAVKAAITLMLSSTDLTELDLSIAETFWSDLREQQLSFFTALAATETLYRLALPAACGPLSIPFADTDLVMEWHGQERWIKAAGDDATFAALKLMAFDHGGHVTRFRCGDATHPAGQRFTLLREQAHSIALEAVQARLRLAFDPLGVFNTGRLP